MRDGADDQQADDSTLKEDHEQLPDVEGQLGAEDQTADLGEVEHLRDGDDRDDEAGHVARTGARDQDGRGKHIGKADDHRGSGSGGIRHLQQLEQGQEGRAEDLEDVGVVGADQRNGADAHNGGQDAEPHITGVLCAVLKEPADAGEVRNALERELHAVLAGALVALGDGLRRSFALDHIGLGLFVQGPQQRADQRADDADEADEQVVNAEVLHHPDLIEHDQRKGDGNGGEERRDDARLLSGVVAALILVEGQHDTERAVADPRGHAVDRGAAGDLEERAHELRRQRADILEQTEVGQQRQQEGRDHIDDDQRADQIIEHETALIGAGDGIEDAAPLVGAQLKKCDPREDRTQHTHDDPERTADEAAVKYGAFHDELGLCQRHERHHSGDRHDRHAQNRQESTDRTGNNVRDDLDRDRPLACRVFDRDHKENNTDRGRNDKHRFQFTSVFHILPPLIVEHIKMFLFSSRIFYMFSTNILPFFSRRSSAS